MSDKLEVVPLHDWIDTKGKPLMIAGPCSAETEEQVHETVAQIAAEGFAHVLRAGVWKPRTRPGSFEGMGEAALPWLTAAKKAAGLPLAVEVATPEHIELALKYGVDILWIGARTTVNPFNVQEIADALRGVDVPVLVKNPVNPDLALWIGAFERLQNSGLKKLGAIHRGFSNMQENKYRNSPMWQLALELKRLHPDLPLIGDPSHMAGKRDYLAELTQRFMDLDYDGLIIETHRDPAAAWSDAAQQLTPAALSQLLASVEVPQPDTPDKLYHSHMDELRARIDNIDRELLEVLAARMAIVEKMGEYKRDNSVTIFQIDRWKQVHASRAEMARKLGLYSDLVEDMYRLIHEASIRRQTEVMHHIPQP